MLYIKKKPQINNLTLQLKETENEEQSQKLAEIRAEINETEIRKTQNTNRTKCCLKK